ncbi:RRNA-processing protein Fcf2 [Ceratobasidium theobromae]|uniref:rRNA-processing protein Fcf2 n=1 Tax=Ceratobasidium theobromae TaxID=1582974 RepID=A0A5N5QRB3_9AGAM|nr:RRNA-processing protein Fcf2 [Ceratobasidium theobromae]
MSRAPSPAPSTSSEASISEESQKRILEELIQKAEKACTVNTATDEAEEEELLTLAGEDDLPQLNPGLGGRALYFECRPVSDPQTFELEDNTTAQNNRTKSQDKGKGKQKGDGLPEEEDAGKKLTKRERKEMRLKTAGPQWFDLPAPSDDDRPRLARELEALRLRNALDPKRFYRKDAEGSKREIPKYFAIGKVVDAATPFRDADRRQNLTRAERKRTIVEELVEDVDARRYAKKKFADLQAIRSERGRGTLARKFAKRKPKW